MTSSNSLTILFGLLFTLTSSAMGGTILDSEPNDTFETSQFVPNSVTSIIGGLSGGAVDLNPIAGRLDQQLFTGAVDAFTFSGLPASTQVYAYTDNNNGVGEPDTMLGQFTDNSFSDLIQFNDDVGIGVGNGLASGFTAEVNSAGDLYLAVTGYPDFQFNGSHEQLGNYDLLVSDTIPGSDSDLDFFAIPGLVPDSPFSLEVTTADFDTILGVFDAGGNLIDSDDDGGEGLLSQLEGLVPSDGTLRFALSAFSDFGFTGDHSRTGDYTLATDVVPLPEPSSFAVFGIGTVCLYGGSFRRRKTRR